MCLAVPGEIVAIEVREGLPFGTVRFGEVTRSVCLATIPDAEVGEYVLVHVGFAIARVDRDEAERNLAWLDALGEGEL